MAWWWRLETSAGDGRGDSEQFESQSDAETWIGLEFADLLDQGIDQATLIHDGEEVYGPMGLAAE